MIHIFYVKFVVVVVVYIDRFSTFKNKAHARVLTTGFFVVASENENLIFVQGSPTTATQQSELAVHVFNGWVNLCPHVALGVPDFDGVVVFPIGEHSTHFY